MLKLTYVSIACTLVILFGFTHAEMGSDSGIGAGASASTNPNRRSTYDNSSPKDDSLIDIDEEAIEGSGGGSELQTDLESSGSGFGPDDEDDVSGSSDINHDLNSSGEKKYNIPKKIDRLPDERNNIDKGVKIDNDLDHLDTKVSTVDGDSNQLNNDVFIMNPKTEDRATSFFAQPGILAAVIGGAVVGLLCAILVVMFIVYRMRKKDEGSYALDEPKRSPTVNSYAKNSNREFYA
ncbi:syndecan [Chrysoperla carnea]|uniref:syndecan n=1 Tax=Chrysoperla carnea TaxID=189513 RepID=UPI001D066DDF|nr:syndecan [Chrysoperla carnea]